MKVHPSVVFFLGSLLSLIFFLGGHYIGWSSYKDNHPAPAACAQYGDGQACVVDGELIWQADQQPVNLTEQAKFNR